MRIAVIDDDPDILFWFQNKLKGEEYEVLTAPDANSGYDLIAEHNPQIALIDYVMPGMDGLELTSRVAKDFPETQVIFMTAHGSIETAVKAMQNGANEYLGKPLELGDLQLKLRKVEESITLTRENRLLRQQIRKLDKGDIFATNNKDVQRLLHQATNVASTDSTILITGENGTGKEVFAKYLYRHSSRSKAQFVVVNCAALTEQLLESELFGHAKGSFTSAHSNHAGYFEIADGGTIFLDEIAELSPAMQVRLLRVLQEKEFSRVGETKIRRTDIRIMSASNRDLAKLIDEGKFREDFYYRVNVFEFRLPPLRERPEDIMLYFDMFVNDYATQMNKSITGVNESVKQTLLGYRWPGNIRELKNVAERASILYESDTGIITHDLIPERLGRQNSNNFEAMGSDFKLNKEQIINKFEVSFITKELHKYRGNVAATARAIGVHPVFLRQKISNLGIDARSIRKRANQVTNN